LVFEGELVIVLNSSANEEEAMDFARNVFEFPAATLVLCNTPPSLKSVAEAINKRAGELGRSVLTAPDWPAVVQLFRPDRTFYFNHRNKRHLDVGKMIEPLKSDKTVAVVFGSPVGKEAEIFGLETEVNLPAAASIILYAMQEALNPAGPVQN
jgi:SpoU rRNA methylase family enzyme